jgi:hypothetical protein
MKIELEITDKILKPTKTKMETSLFIVGYDKFWDKEEQKDMIHDIIKNLNANLFVVTYEGCFMDIEELFPKNLRYVCRKNVDFHNKKMRNIIDMNNHPQPSEHNLSVYMQYNHIENCFEEMEIFENSINSLCKYVFKIRSDIKIQNYRSDLDTFIEPKKIYMESDYMYYGLREEMKIVCHLLSAKFSYYDKTRWDDRPLNYDIMLKTLENNPKYIFDTNRWNQSLFKNKLPAIPVPILPENYGSLCWEISPREYFIKVCEYFLTGNGKNIPKNSNIPMTSLTLFDREPHLFQCEYFIVDWAIRNNVVVCEPIYFTMQCIVRN